ncbi:MAG: sel1 repeat family protein [Deltaproteobacteria bacterium]|nr:sel1 repeat family protein [Deltaproteobacteria bacterium]
MVKNLQMVPLLIAGFLMLSTPLFALGLSIDQLRQSADKGNPVAQYKLANSFFNGRGIVRNKTEALAWYMKAAENGYINAQYRLGVIYQTGNGAPKNYKKALSWYLKAAAMGYAGAQNNLGKMYEKGEGIEQNVVSPVIILRLTYGVHGQEGEGIPPEEATYLLLNQK